ncbi:hypothetical protein [Saccharomonospora xinjiangensis]|uniref:hypothetical protein n=1 Tax=Saccharomonospora xinjiangensis TaxID=75294 RepID=UPI001E5007FD|nr:hypothetical protein [Saccharomonospora xinjiangensis]
MLPETFGHAQRTENADLAGAAAFDVNRGLQGEVGAPNRWAAMPGAVRRKFSPFRQFRRNPDNAGLH